MRRGSTGIFAGEVLLTLKANLHLIGIRFFGFSEKTCSWRGFILPPHFRMTWHASLPADQAEDLGLEARNPRPLIKTGSESEVGEARSPQVSSLRTLDARPPGADAEGPATCGPDSPAKTWSGAAIAAQSSQSDTNPQIHQQAAHFDGAKTLHGTVTTAGKDMQSCVRA